jgi:hypothetical protein
MSEIRLSDEPLSSHKNRLYALKRPRRKATPKPKKAPSKGLSPRQQVLFSIGADLIRALYPQRDQATMFAVWCAQDFDTNEHAYSQSALVKTSDRYAATYSMPRAGRSTIASRSPHLKHVTVHHREEVGVSDKDYRMRRMVQSNCYRLDIAGMIQELHELDPEHVMPVWDRMLRSLEEDQDHLIWTLSWMLNWPLNWRYSSTSNTSSSSSASSSSTSSPLRGAREDADAAGEDSEAARLQASPGPRAARSARRSRVKRAATPPGEVVEFAGEFAQGAWAQLDPLAFARNIHSVAQSTGLPAGRVMRAVDYWQKHSLPGLSNGTGGRSKIGPGFLMAKLPEIVAAHEQLLQREQTPFRAEIKKAIPLAARVWGDPEKDVRARYLPGPDDDALRALKNFIYYLNNGIGHLFELPDDHPDRDLYDEVQEVLDELKALADDAVAA